ncbi:hypothetical protein NLR71_004521 [Escherichia coli]|uniref:hypothetical protein n=1 Tax=Escherichia coli TaxID=562 RepID=UPI000A885646|nr:hypothetical protein [Escherichia coli]EHL6328765.1 hypothetical protein [Escherichia coli]EHR7939428.1 hypothetical protein [Escherichia coli]EJC7995633.1 hypothetical protein [Escherichia coli]EJK7366660.1 hypothetical protein [Escherichia coli]ELK4237092.1 hypothetical protein [Escherichia coli]
MSHGIQDPVKPFSYRFRGVFHHRNVTVSANDYKTDSKAHALFVTVKNDGETAKANNNESIVRIPLH